jgi:hypothetical protein
MCPKSAPSFSRKHSYLRLPIGIAGSPDIFQAKMLVPMIALELVKTY